MTRLQQLLVVVGLPVLAVVLIREDVVTWQTVVAVAALIPAVILHEVSHAVAALAFGDDTAKRAGRVTLNPAAHVDPLGTLLLPSMLAVASQGAFTFGYAKPVPVVPRRMRSPRNHGLLTSLAGPVTNIVLAVIAVLTFRILGLDPFERDTDPLTRFVYAFGAWNVVLALFNLLPIPPLDGSAMVERVLPVRYWDTYLRLRQYSIVLLLIVVFALPLERVFDPVLDFWERFL